MTAKGFTIMRIDLNLFTVFNAIYTEQNLTRAAEVLNLTQPAISHALKRLRDAFNDPLFQRKNNRMVPTPVAKNIADDIQQALGLLNLTTQASQQFIAHASKRQFKISLHELLESFYLPPLMQQISQLAPQVSLNSLRINRADLSLLLASGEIDLALDVLLPVGEDIQHQQLQQDRAVVLAQQNHPLIKQHLDQATYLAQQHIIVSSRASGASLEDFELSRLGLQRKVGLRCKHHFSACRVVENSTMLLTLPKSIATILVTRFAVKIYELPINLPYIDLHLYWHKSAALDPANQWLRSLIINCSNIFQENL